MNKTIDTKSCFGMENKQEAIDAILKEKWKELEDVPFDDIQGEDMTLAEDWWKFKKGTHREKIWHFFDEHYSRGVASLLYWEASNE